MKLKSRIITEKKQVRLKVTQKLSPVHPGEMLREEFMEPLGLSAHALAMALHVPATRITEIVKERRGISGDTALRLGHYFRMTPQFWMNLQSHYELEVARHGMSKKWDTVIEPAPIGDDGVLLARTA